MAVLSNTTRAKSIRSVSCPMGELSHNISGADPLTHSSRPGCNLYAGQAQNGRQRDTRENPLRRQKGAQPVSGHGILTGNRNIINPYIPILLWNEGPATFHSLNVDWEKNPYDEPWLYVISTPCTGAKSHALYTYQGGLQCMRPQWPNPSFTFPSS